MKTADVESGDIVAPGDRLCVIEELIPSHGTYEDEGVVYAATMGKVAMNLKERKIEVLSKEGRKRLSLPVEGDTLIGEVDRVYDQRAEVRVVKRNEEYLYNPYPAEIHISNITRRYVKSLNDVMVAGDLIRAESLSTHEMPIELSIVGSEYGVILAKCKKCGNALTHTKYDNMICLRCENRATRTVASDYGERFGVESRPDLAPSRRSGRNRRRR
ncbi:MAG: exosome complex RNA-binding protein Csl4 [Candidatus Thorarchaeota archaeon]